MKIYKDLRTLHERLETDTLEIKFIHGIFNIMS